MISKHVVVGVLVCLCISLTASAAVIPISGNSRDTMAQSSLTTRYFTEDPLRIGGNTSSTDAAGVLVFQLPVLGPDETIGAANLDVHLVRVAGSPLGAVDLYGLGYRAASTVLGTDFYQGVYAGDTTDAWALQDDIMTVTTPGASTVSTDAGADGALAAYLNAQYDAGAQGGEYVFLRLNGDVTDQGSYRYWLVASANNTTAANRPVLTVTTVPEPATLALLAVGGLTLARRKK